MILPMPDWEQVDHELSHCTACGRPLAWWTANPSGHAKPPTQRRAICMCRARYETNLAPEPPASHPGHAGPSKYGR
jgi:hypothetical protein